MGDRHPRALCNRTEGMEPGAAAYSSLSLRGRPRGFRKPGALLQAPSPTAAIRQAARASPAATTHPKPMVRYIIYFPLAELRTIGSSIDPV